MLRTVAPGLHETRCDSARWNSKAAGLEPVHRVVRIETVADLCVLPAALRYLRIVLPGRPQQPLSAVCGNTGSHHESMPVLGCNPTLTSGNVARRLEENITGNVEGHDATFSDTGRAG